MTELEKIDILRERGRLSYQEARSLLNETGGDLIEALVRLEQRGTFTREKIYAKGNEIVEKVKDLIRQGNVTKIRVKTKDDVILDIPVTAGAAVAVFAPYLALLGAVAALATQCSIEIERAEPRVTVGAVSGPPPQAESQP
ncbi:MAG TPA: DUF4342 domain-containing protein [Firmicutes bacterium]|nr:DUF4342 domain-containing protein [Bacillota bacterium]